MEQYNGPRYSLLRVVIKVFFLPSFLSFYLLFKNCRLHRSGVGKTVSTAVVVSPLHNDGRSFFMSISVSNPRIKSLIF